MPGAGGAIRPGGLPGRLALGLAALLIALGVTVLAGWILRMPALIQIQPHLPPMTRNVAAAFLLLGIALLVLALDGPRWLAGLCAAPVLAVSSIAFAEIALRFNSGLNEILGPSYITVQLRSPGRMAPITAICLALGSASLLLAAAFGARKSALLLALGGCVIAAFGMAATSGLWTNPALAAVHTGAGLAVLGAAMLALAWQVDAGAQGTPRWLPLGTALTVTAMTIGLWRVLVIGGHPPFAPMPAVVLGAGVLVATLFAMTVHLAQRAQAHASALRRSEAFLQEAQALSRTGSFSWSVSTGSITCSQQLYRILELDPAQPVTLALVAARFSRSEWQELVELATKATSAGTHVFEYEQRLQAADGTEKFLHLVAHGTRDKAGDLEYIGAIQDVTQRRRSEDALIRTRSELARVARITSLGALTASIAHEIHQPLTAIIANASTALRMLDAQPPNVAGASETARRTIRDANRAAEVIARLRGLFAKGAPSTESLDLNDAAREVIALASSELQRSRVQLHTELAGEPLPVWGDRVQIQQVILNLVLNGSEAMSGIEGRPRVMRIRTERDGDVHRLTVQDSGVGVDAHTAERLFDAFYTTKSQGMGIGLSVSRSIIESHHGRLWASANDGPGATFSFALPVRATRTAAH